MANSRRDFIKRAALGTMALGSAISLLKAENSVVEQLTILHTNDVHSQIEPLPVNHNRFPGQGGFARRAALISSIKQSAKNVLLFDSGDIFQGTPYFNYFKGKLEIDLMSRMGYSAGTIGNHEFDNGVEMLAKRVQEAQFPFICSNYDFEATPLKGLTKPFKVFELDQIKVGVIGVGIELTGLVDPSMSGGTIYRNPVEVANGYAHKLKHELGCNIVVCLSHLGYEYVEDKVSDVVLAQKSSDIDVILGGHTHTYLEKPRVENNLIGKQVAINQAGSMGVRLGRIDMTVNKTNMSASLINHQLYHV